MALQKKEKSKPTGSKESFLKRNQWQLLLAALVFIIYANSVPNGYNLDDELVTRNHRFTSKGLEAIPDILTNPYYADAMGYKYEYRPVVHVTFAIEHQFFGESAKTSHFFNLLLYALLCIVLYNLLKQLFAERYPWLPIIASIIFVVHPIHTEVVCSIKNRDEILSLLFMLLAWKYALNFFYEDIKAGIFSILFIALSLLSKNTSFSLLFLIPLSTLLVDRKPSDFIFLLFPTAPLIVSYFCVPNLQPVFVLFSVALYAVTLFVLFIKNREAVIEFSKNIFRNAGSGVSEITGNFIRNFGADVLSPALPRKKEGIAILIFSVAYLSVCSATLNFHLLLLNFVILLAALQFFRKYYLRIMILLMGIIIYYLLFCPNLTLIIWLLYIAITIFVILAMLAKDNIALIIAVAYVVCLGIMDFYVTPIILIVLSAVFIRTRQLKWAYLLLVMYNVLNLGGLMDLFKEDDPSIPWIYAGEVIATNIFIFILIKGKEKLTTWLLNYETALMVIAFILLALFYGKSPKIATAVTKQESTLSVQNKVSFEAQSTERNLEFPELPVGLNPSPSIRFGTASSIFTQYLKLITIAYPLSYYYGYAVIKPTPIYTQQAIVGGVLGLALVLAMILFYKRNIAISIGIAFFLITLFPFLNIIVPLPGMMGDRFLLIPSIGFCTAIAGMLHYFIDQGKKPWAGLSSVTLLPMVPKVVLTIIVLMYSGLTIARNEQWENHLVLFQHDIEHLDESTQAHNLLALQYTIYSFDQKDPAVQLEYRLNAEKHFKRAIEIYPPFFNPHYDLARLNEVMNRPDSALKYYQRTITIDSTFPTPYKSASRICQAKNDIQCSIGWLEHGLRFDSMNLEMYNLLSYDLYRTTNYKASAEINKLAMKRLGVNADLLAHVGQAYLSAIELDSARVYLEKANALNPNVQGLQSTLQQLNKLQPPTNTPATQAIQPK